MSRRPTPEPAPERGLSSVVGVLLLVAVTVLITTAVGVNALGAIPGPFQSEVAAFSLDGDADADRISLTYFGGDPLVAAEVTVVVSNGTVTQRFEPSSTDAKLTPGTTATIDLARTAGNNRIDWNGSTGTLEYNQTGGFAGIDPESDLTVSVVSAGNVLFKGTVPPEGSSDASPRQLPNATFTYDRKGVSHIVELNASGSTDPDGGTITTYEWDVGDDGSIDYTGRTVPNAHVGTGEAVTLVVTDDEGSSNETTETIP